MNEIIKYYPNITPTNGEKHYSSRGYLITASNSSAVFSDSLVRNKNQILPNEMDVINEKIRISMSFDMNWNGENTYPPSQLSLDLTSMITDLYNVFLNSYMLLPSSVQGYPLNQGGFALEFISDKATLNLEIIDNFSQLLNLDYFSSTRIDFYLTNDIDFEKEGTVNFQQIQSLFYTLHELNNDSHAWYR